MTTPILKNSDALIVSIHDSLPDSAWRQLRDDLLRRASELRSRGVVLDVSAMDVMDSFAARMIDVMAEMLRLRGTDTVVVGIQPGVAFAMSQLGLRMASAGTALDLDEGLRELRRRAGRGTHAR